MWKLFYAAILGLLTADCSKSSKDEPSWLIAKKMEYSDCSCQTGFRKGIYNTETVIEIYLLDSLCDGINIVYKFNGSLWFTSFDPIYRDYSVNVKDQETIWTCSK